jgi:hypothetical protein
MNQWGVLRPYLMGFNSPRVDAELQFKKQLLS